MKIKKEIIESIIEEELHSVLMENKDSLSEDWKSAFVRGLTAGGKRKNIFTDTIASMMVPGVTKEAHQALTQALKAIEGMKGNATWDAITVGSEKSVEGSTSAAAAAASEGSETREISLGGMEKIIRGLLKDLQVLAAQLGADKPNMPKTEDPPGGAPAPKEGGSAPKDAEDYKKRMADAGLVTTEALKRSIKEKLRMLKSTS